MKIFYICFAVIVASIVSGVAGAIGVSARHKVASRVSLGERLESLQKSDERQ